jgi:nitrite reductase/ring-hydroxylating ferredoxin subunit
MLSAEENELMCRVGPGTPMGDLMRQYWLPALLSSELPAVDSEPLRLRLLGENLIAFRVTSGAAGIVANACPHRGASLFFGRNEEEGLRCVYHGWKFDVEGNSSDMNAGTQDWRISSPMGVPGPTLQRTSLSCLLSIADAFPSAPSDHTNGAFVVSSQTP